MLTINDISTVSTTDHDCLCSTKFVLEYLQVPSLTVPAGAFSTTTSFYLFHNHRSLTHHSIHPIVSLCVGTLNWFLQSLAASRPRSVCGQYCSTEDTVQVPTYRNCDVKARTDSKFRFLLPSFHSFLPNCNTLRWKFSLVNIRDGEQHMLADTVRSFSLPVAIRNKNAEKSVKTVVCRPLEQHSPPTSLQCPR